MKLVKNRGFKSAISQGTLLLMLGIPAIIHAGEYYSLNMKTDLPLAVGALVLSGLGQYAYYNLDEVNSKHLHSENLPLWDRWAKGRFSHLANQASDAALALTILPLAAVSLSNPGENKIGNTLIDAVMYAEAVVLSSGLYLLVRGLGSKPRPLVYNANAPASQRTAPDASSSFYSGHASGAFMTAVFTSCLFQKQRPASKLHPWVWAVTLATAASTATFRVCGGKHYPSDVLAGGLIGASIGFLIPHFHSSHPKRAQIRLDPKTGSIRFQYSV